MYGFLKNYVKRNVSEKRSINRSLLRGRDAKWPCYVSRKTLGLLKSKMKNDNQPYHFIGKKKGIDIRLSTTDDLAFEEEVPGLL